MTGESWYANADALAASDPEEIISYTYNTAGDITSESDFNCAQSAVVSADYYTYNDSDQLTSVVETVAGGPAVELVYTYNDSGQCSGVTASIGGSVDSSGNYSGGTLDYQNTYGYDANGDLTQIIQTGQTGGDAVAGKEIDLTYNAAGQFQSITRYENGQLVAESDYTYNSAGQLTSLVHQQGSSNVLASYAYTYGTGTALASVVQPVTPTVWTPSGATLPFNDPSQIDVGSLDQAPSLGDLLASVTSVDGTATYSYDAMGELTSASCTGAQPSESYSWDANGNPSGSGYVIGPDNELLSDGTYNYTYNADGDCTSRTDIATGAVTDYTWDARNRLVGVTDETSTDQITQTVTYVYDVENRCVSETVTAYSDGNPASVHTTDFAYDGNQIVLQFDATSTPGTPVTLTANTLSHRYLSGPAVDQVMCDERVTLENGALATDEVLWPLTDAQGTIRDVAKLTGTTAAVVDHIMYNGFGSVVNESDPSQGVLFKSTGCFTDPATNIEFHEERVKIAGSTDWLSQDPIRETSGTTNLSDYCGNDPVNATDPSGLAPSDSPSDGSGVAAYLDGLLNGNGNGQFSTLAKRFFSNAIRPSFQSLGEVGSFGKGLLIGFFGDGLWGNVRGIWDAFTLSARVAWYYAPWSVASRVAQGDLFSGERYYLNKVQAIAGPALNFLNNLGTSLGEEAYREYDVITNGSPNDLRALGSQHRQVAAFMLGVAVELQALFTNLSPETKGRIEGVILWEVALTVGTVGVGQAAKAGRFAGILAKLQEWTEVPAIAQFVQRLGRSERLAELAASLDRLGGYVGEAVSAFKNLGVVRYVTGFVQTTENCCGITAIRYVLKLTGRTAGAAGEAAIDAAYQLLQLPGNKLGLPVKALLKLVRDVGFKAAEWVDLPTREIYGGKMVCNTSRLLQMMEEAMEAGPVIASSTGYNHAVVVEKIADGMVEVMDPADGVVRSVPWVDFCNWLSSQVAGAGFISLR